MPLPEVLSQYGWNLQSLSIKLITDQGLYISVLPKT